MDGCVQKYQKTRFCVCFQEIKSTFRVRRFQPTFHPFWQRASPSRMPWQNQRRLCRTKRRYTCRLTRKLRLKHPKSIYSGCNTKCKDCSSRNGRCLRRFLTCFTAWFLVFVEPFCKEEIGTMVLVPQQVHCLWTWRRADWDEDLANRARMVAYLHDAQLCTDIKVLYKQRRRPTSWNVAVAHGCVMLDKLDDLRQPHLGLSLWLATALICTLENTQTHSQQSRGTIVRVQVTIPASVPRNGDF